MAALSKYARRRVVALKRDGLTNSAIVLILEREGILTDTRVVQRLYKRFCETGSIARKSGSGRPTLLTATVLRVIEEMMQSDDETTALQLQRRLRQQGADISLTTILRGRRKLGWTFHRSAYCQLIREVNKQKRLEWARDHLADDFSDVIWSDETTVQLETHKRFCCRKKGERPRAKPRAKHPVKVHVWAGIGWHGPTRVCVFEGCMNADLYVQILQEALLPTLSRPEYANGHRFMQDNDPKHTSRKAAEFFAENGVNWWRTPPESPDANPIENLWHELKVILYYK